MKLFLISQDINRGLDTYDSAVVAAENERSARMINPDPDGWKVPFDVILEWRPGGRPRYNGDLIFTDWAYTPSQVKVEYIGEAKEGTEEGIILASYNAG